MVWAALFPHDPEAVEAPYRTETRQPGGGRRRHGPSTRRPPGEIGEIRAQIAGEYQRGSYLGRAGRLIEPAVRPLGWDWRIGCAAIASFPAREVVVATLGVLFDVGEEEAEAGDGSSRLQSALKTAVNPGPVAPCSACRSPCR